MFDIILDEDLSLEKLSGYEVLILPDFACLSDKQWEEIESFVREGGRWWPLLNLVYMMREETPGLQNKD